MSTLLRAVYAGVRVALAKELYPWRCGVPEVNGTQIKDDSDGAQLPQSEFG